MHLVYKLMIGLLLPLLAYGANIESKNLLSFHTEPEIPLQGKELSVFIQAETALTNNETLLQATFDGNPVRIVNSGEDLWAVQTRVLSEIKNHTLDISIFVRDAKTSQRIRSAIATLNQEIISLENQILNEPDPVKKANLEAQKENKSNYKTTLEAELDNLKKFLKQESFSFTVAADTTNNTYPKILSVSPNTSPLAKRIRVSLLGENFPVNPIVRIGGQNSTIIDVTSSTLTVLAPNFSTSGNKIIELIAPPLNGEPRKNTILNNAYHVSDKSVLVNLRPVAVAPKGYISHSLASGLPIELDALLSYDENADAFMFDWSFQKVVSGSNVTIGQVLPNVPNPTFTLDKVGVYTVKLVISETATVEQLNSYAHIITIEVKP